MIKNLTDYLERTVKHYSDKIAYCDEKKAITFAELRNRSRSFACKLLKDISVGTPVVVYMSKSVEMLEAFLGISYAGGFYVPIDVGMPENKVKQILDTLSAEHIVMKKSDQISVDLFAGYQVYDIEDVEGVAENCQKEVEQRQKQLIDSDPAYAIFTSGSTGIPKGVLVSHRSVINFTEWWCETFEFNSEEVFGNQTPFYFDASVKDIYATLRCGATMHIIPKKLFSLPKRLAQFLNEKKITCIDWVPSALCMLVNFNALKKEKPQYLKKVMFLGEVMPTKQFNIWRKALPEVQFANLYGPTEATGDCTYYKIEREIEDTEPIPIGFPCCNTEVLLLDGDNVVTKPNQIGEICVRGVSLALGYYNNAPETNNVFVQNPLQRMYPEKIYRTGDLAKYNSYHELVFVSRKDFQIKHMGYRIELGEIESVLSAEKGIASACCFYNKGKREIHFVYVGLLNEQEVLSIARSKLPNYMTPQKVHRIDYMPLNNNGKIDRAMLQQQFIEE